MESLKSGANHIVEQRRKHLTNALHALTVVESLPEAISNYPADSISIGTYYGGDLSLSVSFDFIGKNHEDRAAELIATLAELGVVMKREDLSDRELWSKPTCTSWHGEVDTDSGKVSFTVSGMPLPPTCEIEQIDVTDSEPQRSFRYKVKCNKQPNAEEPEESN